MVWLWCCCFSARWGRNVFHLLFPMHESEISEPVLMHCLRNDIDMRNPACTFSIRYTQDSIRVFLRAPRAPHVKKRGFLRSTTVIHVRKPTSRVTSSFFHLLTTLIFVSKFVHTSQPALVIVHSFIYPYPPHSL